MTSLGVFAAIVFASVGVWLLWRAWVQKAAAKYMALAGWMFALAGPILLSFQDRGDRGFAVAVLIVMAAALICLAWRGWTALQQSGQSPTRGSRKKNGAVDSYPTLADMGRMALSLMVTLVVSAMMCLGLRSLLMFWGVSEANGTGWIFLLWPLMWAVMAATINLSGRRWRQFAGWLTLALASLYPLFYLQSA